MAPTTTEPRSTSRMPFKMPLAALSSPSISSSQSVPNAKPTRISLVYKVVQQAGNQAIQFLDSNKTLHLHALLVSTGMSKKEAWKRVALYPKTLFDSTKLVQGYVLDLEGATMVWGSFQTTVLIAEYARHHFWIIQGSHPCSHSPLCNLRGRSSASWQPTSSGTPGD